MLPQVIMHNLVSIDGRISGFQPNLGLHYGIAGRLGCDAHLAGSNTILALPGESTEVTADDHGPGEAREPDQQYDAAEQSTGDSATGGLLVIPDSRGRVRTWRSLLRQGFWNRGIALCSRSTPSEHFDRLRAARVETIVAGDEKVDVRRALEELHARFNVHKVLLDTGPILAGVMLAAGLVTEISLVISPHLVGGAAENMFSKLVLPGGGATSAKLVNAEQVADGYAWLRYRLGVGEGR